MPLLHENKLIFIHIPKNGGKTVEIVFGIHDDFYKSHNSRSFLNKVAKFLLNKTSNKQAINKLVGVGDKSLTLQHVTLQEIILLNLVDLNLLDEYTKIAVLRNPYDRAFSLFNHWNKINDLSILNVEYYFNDFLNLIPKIRTEFGKRHNVYSHFRNQVDYLRDLNGEIPNDFVLLRLEKLENDIKKFAKEYDIWNLNLNTLKNYRKESDYDLREKALSERNLLLIKNLFKDDFIFLNSYYDL